MRLRPWALRLAVLLGPPQTSLEGILGLTSAKILVLALHKAIVNRLQALYWQFCLVCPFPHARSPLRAGASLDLCCLFGLFLAVGSNFGFLLACLVSQMAVGVKSARFQGLGNCLVTWLGRCRPISQSNALVLRPNL